MSDSPGITVLEAIGTKGGCHSCASIAGHSGWCVDNPERVVFSLNWMADAVCGNMEMFPESAPETRAAKDTCRDCPVRKDCLAYALEARMEHGIWGGLTPPERKEVRYEIRTGELTLEEAVR